VPRHAAPSGAFRVPGAPSPSGVTSRDGDAPRDDAALPLFRIREVAAATGLTARSIRYYEEVGLLRPAARSQGDYRLYDASDLERLRFIRDLRDDAGFSLAEIALLLEDEEARIRDRERFRASADTAEKRTIVRDLVERMDRQVATLEAKAGRLRAMIEAAEARRDHLRAHLAELEGARPAHADRAPAAPPQADPMQPEPRGPVDGPAPELRP
jgi:DNA-binding transcriptional MerR regulator